MKKTVEISTFEYNYLRNQLAACERALQVILEQTGQSSGVFGNVRVYLAADDGVGAVFLNEDGERLKDLDFANFDLQTGVHPRI